MPRTKEISGKIPRIYQRCALDLMMFGYVCGVRNTLHTITIPQAILMFIEEYEIEIEDFNTKSALVIFNRMQKEMIDSKKTV